MSKSLAVASGVVVLAAAFFYPVGHASADPLSPEVGHEIVVVVPPASTSKQEATKLLEVGNRLDAATRARLGLIQTESSAEPVPAASPSKSQFDRGAASERAAAKTGAKLEYKDCIGSGDAYTVGGRYKSRWSWCQTHDVHVAMVVNGTIVGRGSFDSTLIGEGIRGSRTVKLWQYITNVRLSGAWRSEYAVMRFTIPCGGWPTAKNCIVQGGQTLQLGNRMERLISYKYTSSTSGAVEVEKVGIGVFKPKYVMAASGWTATGYEQGFRCDSATYLGKNGACVFDRLMAKFKLSRSDSAVDKSAKHIYDAQRGVANIYPAKGKKISASLTRMTNKASITANRSAARAACKKKWPKKPAGKDCDEYPFASTNQGAAKAKGRFSVRYITSGDNRTSGRRLGAWYKADRILDGERFTVKITS